MDTGKVCTAEAVVSALLALSILTNDEAALLIGIAERKVKDTAAYQGSVRLLTELKTSSRKQQEQSTVT